MVPRPESPRSDGPACSITSGSSGELFLPPLSDSVVLAAAPTAPPPPSFVGRGVGVERAGRHQRPERPSAAATAAATPPRQQHLRALVRSLRDETARLARRCEAESAARLAAERAAAAAAAAAARARAPPPSAAAGQGLRMTRGKDAAELCAAWSRELERRQGEFEAARAALLLLSSSNSDGGGGWGGGGTATTTTTTAAAGGGAAATTSTTAPTAVPAAAAGTTAAWWDPDVERARLAGEIEAPLRARLDALSAEAEEARRLLRREREAAASLRRALDGAEGRWRAREAHAREAHEREARESRRALEEEREARGRERRRQRRAGEQEEERRRQQRQQQQGAAAAAAAAAATAATAAVGVKLEAALERAVCCSFRAPPKKVQSSRRHRHRRRRKEEEEGGDSDESDDNDDDDRAAGKDKGRRPAAEVAAANARLRVARQAAEALSREAADLRVSLLEHDAALVAAARGPRGRRGRCGKADGEKEQEGEALARRWRPVGVLAAAAAAARHRKVDSRESRGIVSH